MVVQHNLTAMNSNRMLGVTTSSQAKSTEKLSSGYKINRAADDAAGLSISEKMRKQIRGLTQASLNAEDGISAVQTAEGALNEVQDMLQRANELAVKAANGTMSENDRNYIQDEIDQLMTEIDRVSTTTKFNETYLLKGDAEKATVEADTDLTLNGLTKTIAEGTNVEAGQKVLLGTMQATGDVAITGTTDAGTGGTLSATGATITADKGTYTYKAEEATYAAATGKDLYAITATYAGTDVTYTYQKLTSADDIAAAYAAIKDPGYTTTDPVAAGSVTYYATATTGATVEGADTFDTDLTKVAAAGIDNAITKTTTQAAGWYADGATTATDLAAAGLTISNAEAGDTITIGDEVELTAADGVTGTYTGDTSALEAGDEVYGYITVSENGTVGISATAPASTDPLVLKLHVGADSTDDNQISVSIDSMSAKGLGLLDADDKLLVNGPDDTNARAAIDTIAAALQQVSTQRSALGAVQNRLEHTIANLDNVVENTTAAESQIRDTDMATEMVRYSNNNILAQAGTSMLAQANQANQNVLSLLG